ncbi:cell division cycle 7-related protein kinase [Plutella xylostella]|uniref:cell division cycle 7-related protein kinase n=1 Tax=Plutella xylostella TaxID=51655 RepID=UPI0020326277|nr:cell division cycle 7-related protein kinase [Plutella xylostella]
MSRIRGIEVRLPKDVINNRKNGHDIVKNKKEDLTAEETDQQQIKELVSKLPKLDKIFELHRKIGVGTFSSVYLGSLRQHHGLAEAERRWFAIKHLVPNTHPARVEHELRCLQEMGGQDNIIGVELCLRHVDTIVFVMPYIPHRKFSEYVSSMDAQELRDYLKALFVALKRVHSFGVIHRDVKPSNFLYDRENKRYLLVDFGLAQRISPPPPAVPPPPPPHPPPAHANSNIRKRLRDEEQSPPAAKRVALDLTVRGRGEAAREGEHAARGRGERREPALQLPAAPPPAANSEVKRPPCACAGVGAVCAACAGRAGARACRAGTGGFRPPEVLLKYPHQGPAVDMWAAGVVLASVLSARYPFFRAADDAGALAELADLLGSAPLQRAAAKLGTY